MTDRKPAPPRKQIPDIVERGKATRFQKGRAKTGGRKKTISTRQVLTNAIEKVGELYGLPEQQRTAADIVGQLMKKHPEIVAKQLVSVLVPRPTYSAVVIEDFDTSDIPAALRRIAQLIAEGEDVGSLRALAGVLAEIQQTQALQAQIDAVNFIKAAGGDDDAD